MDAPVQLNKRQQRVLGATVRHYIATARPVGSEALVEEFQPRVSPATIRNVMGFLEKSGLLFQPHTSAGRVPSDNGYRMYVDHLVTPSEQVARQIDGVLSSKLLPDGYSLEAILRGAAQILSTLSGYISLVTMPRVLAARLRHLQLVQVDPGRLMMIGVLDSYETQSIVIDLPASDNPPDPDLLDRELQVLSNFLNQHLRGRSPTDTATLNWRELGREFDQYAELMRHALSEMHRRSMDSVASQMFVTGVAEVLRRQPEFAEVQQVQPIVHLLESEQEQLCELIFDPIHLQSDRRVTIRIGSENPLEPMKGCTLISAIYHCGETSAGSVGMLGPTRMVYEDAIALVEATAGYLTESLS
ncbi:MULTISPECIES: heat-inducible transcriptional repressor HrcA [unclassified Leptolyngbya]|uniref:heat-inducible transcriptional repressor HrcA n=1 Tax=unclassified Leptolyngbya TaxID=2650499 RepID=UPI0016821B75|nr:MULTISPECIES: heat-inducible transcriptional repressor HrcA [unclassified Leptolyngbya]MBD1910673.1 heat-inducible transcriptional repressor HrcA [Leptolyngbya sp. FACHB-8]MBD2154270.1 heat-inducible transcriptional repressor HrcA [Leptolyngbya sp. FACHB-16]